MTYSLVIKSGIRVGLLLGLLSVTGLADAADILLGAQIGKQYLDIRQSDGYGNVTESTADANTSLGLNVSIGLPGGNGRISAELERYSGGPVDVNLLNFSYTYFFSLSNPASELNLRPFVGAELGYGWMRVDSQRAVDGGNDNGVQIGARTGLSLVISQRTELEAGYRFSHVGLETDLASRQCGAPPTQYEVRNNQGWWVGFHVRL